MEYGVMNCVECGSCVYVCPAKRNIVQYIRNAKAQVKAQQQAAKAKAEAKQAKSLMEEGINYGKECTRSSSYCVLLTACPL